MLITQTRRKGEKVVRKGILKRAERVVIRKDGKGGFSASGQIMKLLQNLNPTNSVLWVMGKQA